MKIRYPVIGIILVLVIMPFYGYLQGENLKLFNAISAILAILFLICFVLLIYLLLRNLFRAIKGQVTKQARSGAEADILRSEVERLSKRVEELEKDR